MLDPVSIRSRRLSAGEGIDDKPELAVIVFQSAPADCRREKGDERIFTRGELLFQSAPADCRREKGQFAVCVDAIPNVSIRSRRLSAGEGESRPCRPYR